MKTIEADGHVYELVVCPDCHSAGKRCMRPSGWEASAWHKARVVLFGQVNAEELAKSQAEWDAVNGASGPRG
jgi:hypothetical protein